MSSKQRATIMRIALLTASGGFFGLFATPASAAVVAVQSGAQLLSKVQAAVASQRGLESSCKAVQEGATEYETTDVGKTSGSQSLTVLQSEGKGSLSAIVVGTTAYIDGNTRGLDILGFVPSAAQAEAGKWISIAKAAQPSAYRSIATDLTSSSVALSLGISGPVSEFRGKALGQNVIELEGTAAHTVPVQTGTIDTIYVPISGTPLPLELVQDSARVEASCIYSHWGQVPHVSAPRGAVAFQDSWT